MKTEDTERVDIKNCLISSVFLYIFASIFLPASVQASLKTPRNLEVTETSKRSKESLYICHISCLSWPCIVKWMLKERFGRLDIEKRFSLHGGMFGQKDVCSRVMSFRYWTVALHFTLQLCFVLLIFLSRCCSFVHDLFIVCTGVSLFRCWVSQDFKQNSQLLEIFVSLFLPQVCPVRINTRWYPQDFLLSSILPKTLSFSAYLLNCTLLKCNIKCPVINWYRFIHFSLGFLHYDECKKNLNKNVLC